MCDYEGLILARQEAEELFEDFACPGCCKYCEFVCMCYEDERVNYDVCLACENQETCKSEGVH